MERLGEGHLTLPEWRWTVDRCARILYQAERSDADVRSVVATARLVTPQTRELPIKSFLPLGVPVSATDAETIRSVMQYATRLAVRSSRGDAQDLLQGASVELMGTRDQSLDELMRAWKTAVSDEGSSITPGAAIQIASLQRALLRQGLQDIEAVSFRDPEQGRMVAKAASDSLGIWNMAIAEWRAHGVSARREEHLGSLAHLASRIGLSLSRAEPAERLRATLGWGTEANLAAALAVTPRVMWGGSPLVGGARTLKNLSLQIRDDLSTLRLAPGSPIPTRQPEPLPGPVTTSSTMEDREARGLRPSAPTSPEHASEQNEVELEASNGDHDGHRSLSRIRDAGVVAQAALEGDEAAIHIAAGATPGELLQLSILGTAATRALVRVGGEMIEPFLESRGISQARPEFQDLVQHISVRVAEYAPRWNPDHARWSSDVYKNVMWGTSDYYRQIQGRRGRGPKPMEISVAPDEMAPSRDAHMQAPAETAAMEIVAAEQLRRDMSAMTGVAGAFVKLRAQGKSMGSIAQELGVSRRALTSYMRLAQRALRPEVPDDHARHPPAVTVERMAALVARKATPRR